MIARKILLTILSSLSITCFANNTDSTKITFYEDITAMSDLTKETEWMTNMIKVLDEFNKNGLKVAPSKGKQKGIPVSEVQLLKLLKSIDVAANSGGKLLVVFVNTDNDKLLNVNTNNIKFNNPLYQIISMEQFHQLLIADKVDFKLIKVDGKFKTSGTDNQFMSDFHMNDAKEYVYAMDLVSGKYPILFEEVNMDISVSWEKYKKTDNAAEIKNILTTTDSNILGEYEHQDTQKSSKGDNVIGETFGFFNMPVEFKGNALTIRCIIKTMTIINIHSGSGQIYAECNKLLL